jgi:ubiquinone/menaquinone biosynthesis C-methylase UbiE
MELGAGTGLNFAHYDPDKVERVVAVEPDPHMRRRAAPRAAEAQVPVELVNADGATLPFDEGSFDEVVCTWVLCTVPDAQATVAELHRVLRPGGRLHFVEHTASPAPFWRALQRFADPVWHRLAGGCHLHRDTLHTLRDAGFSSVTVEPSPTAGRTLVPIYRGVAVR